MSVKYGGQNRHASSQAPSRASVVLCHFRCRLRESCTCFETCFETREHRAQDASRREVSNENSATAERMQKKPCCLQVRQWTCFEREIISLKFGSIDLFCTDCASEDTFEDLDLRVCGGVPKPAHQLIEMNIFVDAGRGFLH